MTRKFSFVRYFFYRKYQINHIYDLFEAGKLHKQYLLMLNWCPPPSTPPFWGVYPMEKKLNILVDKFTFIKALGTKVAPKTLICPPSLLLGTFI